MPKKIILENSTAKHVLIKILISKNKEKNLKVARAYRLGKIIGILRDYSSENHEARRK